MAKTTARPLTATSLDGLLAEATAARAELAAMEHGKLSAPAFLAAAVRVANSTPERIASLRRVIEASADAASLMRTQAFVRRVAREFRSPHWPHPPASADRMGGYGRDECAGELATLGSHMLEAIAVGALVATTTWPDAFGSVEDWAAHERRRATLTARLAEITTQVRVERDRLTQQIRELEAAAAAAAALGL